MTTLLDQVPAAIGRVQREIVLARFIGKLAVDQGVREVRHRLESLVGQDGGVEPALTKPPGTPSTTGADVDMVGNDADGDDGNQVIDAGSLALADYDHLPASDIVSMLADLESDERDAIEAYEVRGRHRRTILGRLAQLRDA